MFLRNNSWCIEEHSYFRFTFELSNKIQSHSPLPNLLMREWSWMLLEVFLIDTSLESHQPWRDTIIHIYSTYQSFVEKNIWTLFLVTTLFENVGWSTCSKFCTFKKQIQVFFFLGGGEGWIIDSIACPPCRVLTQFSKKQILSSTIILFKNTEIIDKT